MVVPPGTHLDDGLGDLDAARAGPRAVEDRATAPDAVGIIHQLQPVGGGAAARVEDQSMRVDDCRRANVAAIAPQWTWEPPESDGRNGRRMTRPSTKQDRQQHRGIVDAADGVRLAA